MAGPFPDSTRDGRSRILGSSWAVIVAALIVTLITWAQFLRREPMLIRTLGDTDDAMRLVLARELLAGRGWYDQWVGRLQPPVGTWMHWSRLLDGALAASMGGFRQFLPPDQAELAVRTAWPLAWIMPAAASSLVIARSLGGRLGLVAGALLLAIDPWTFVQFQPGRIDHHNVQIALTLIAAAFAIGGWGRAWCAAAAGAASALALAIGVESLVFHALIGLGVALGFACEPRLARSARAYGLSLAGAAAALLMIQTPPARWGLSVCDALGLNLTVGLVVAGLGLALVSGLGASPRARLAALAAVGALALGGYLALDPACVQGPMAAVDPRLKPFWFDHIEELKSWPALAATDRPAAIRIASLSLLSLAGAGVLLWRMRGDYDVRRLTMVACAVMAIFATWQALRLEDYAFAFGLPVIAGALASLGQRRNLVLLASASLVLSPAGLGALASRLWPGPSPQVSPNERCYEVGAYRALAELPAGLVLADINLGPFILAHTPHSALAAPYHRMSWGILAAHQALGSPPDRAEAEVRALKVRYIVECGALIRVGPGSFEAALRRGPPPAWLRLLSPAGAALQIFEVAPLERAPVKEP